jgi:hypothetical protein
MGVREVGGRCRALTGCANRRRGEGLLQPRAADIVVYREMTHMGGI